MLTYKGFNVRDSGLMSTVDDFMQSIHHADAPAANCNKIDTARIAIACASACSMLVPLNHELQELQVLKRLQDNGFDAAAAAPVFAPNRIQLKHLTTCSRLRNLMHGGILGALARQLTRDPTQQKQRHQSRNALCIVRRANNEAGCIHVKWSIPEFQYVFNIGIKMYKRDQGQFNALNDADALTLFNQIDNVENRNAFMTECGTLANASHQSRAIRSLDEAFTRIMLDWNVRRPIVVDNMWISEFLAGFIKVCSAKMSAVTNTDALTMDRCTSLVDMYRFVSRIEWILNDPNVRCVLNLSNFYAAHIKRLMYMAEQGIEHSAYMMGRHCPEMMTPELHLHLVPNPKFYMVPQMLVLPNDAVFGAMKVACQGFMPDPPLPSRPLYSDSEYSDSDGYYSDGTDYTAVTIYLPREPGYLDSDGYGTDDTSDVYDYVNNYDDDNVRG